MMKNGSNPERLTILFILSLSCISGCFWRRDKWQKPEDVMQHLQIRKGDRIADIGAGEGYFTFRLADATGTQGRVYAVDVSTKKLEAVRKQFGEQGYLQVVPVLAAADDPRLPEPVDLIFLCNAYHHLTGRVEYFRNIKRYLRPRGRVAIIELNELPWYARWFLRKHRTEASVIKNEMKQAGFELVEKHDFLPYQEFMIFRSRE